MKRPVLLIALLLAFVVSAEAGDFIPGRVLARPADGANEAAVQSSFKAVGAREIGGLPQIGVRILQVPRRAETAVVSALSNNPNFEFAEPDYIANIILTPNDPYYAAYQWHLPRISAPAAWDATTGSADVTVAVVDSGVQAGHPDLAGRVLAGYDFVNNDADASDDNGHGTAVAGVAAARGNDGIGTAGAAWNIAVLPVKVMDSNGSGAYSAIANGINYSADRGARIINLSLGGSFSSRTLLNAVKYATGKGCSIFAAAGNNANSTTVYPAAYNGVTAVSALNRSDTLAYFSSYGSFVDLCAPGDGITTTWGNGGYVTVSGTSFSSPLVAGVAALVLSVNPALSNAEMASLLASNADDLGASGKDIYFGAGRVNAARAVSAALPPPPSDDTTAPSTAVTNPENGATITGLRSVTVSVASSDNIGVIKAELYIDGTLAATGSTGNFDYTWNLRKVAAGSHILQSRAYDAAGNAASSSEISVVR